MTMTCFIERFEEECCMNDIAVEEATYCIPEFISEGGTVFPSSIIRGRVRVVNRLNKGLVCQINSDGAVYEFYVSGRFSVYLKVCRRTKERLIGRGNICERNIQSA